MIEDNEATWLGELSTHEFPLSPAIGQIVRDQLSSIYRKLDVGNRVAALAKLRRLGWRE